MANFNIKILVLKMDSLMDLCFCFGGSAFTSIFLCSSTAMAACLSIVKPGTGFLVRASRVATRSIAVAVSFVVVAAQTCTLLGSRTCFVAGTLVSSERGLRTVAEAVGAAAVALLQLLLLLLLVPLMLLQLLLLALLISCCCCS